MDKLPGFKIFDNDEKVRTYEIMKWFTTKLNKWNFEDEIRCIMPDLFTVKDFPKESGVLIPFDPVQVKEIIFGSKITPAQKKEIKTIIQRCGYKLDSIETENSK